MKVQDDNGSSREFGTATGERKPQEKTARIINDNEDPKSRSGAKDALTEFENADELPVDMNDAQVHKLMSEYLAKMNKGLRV